MGFAGFKPVGGHPSVSAVGSTPTFSRHPNTSAALEGFALSPMGTLAQLGWVPNTMPRPESRR